MDKWSHDRLTQGTAVAVAAPRHRLSEKRSGRRTRVLLPAILVYAKGTYQFDCIIRDLSASGARIVVPKGAQFPQAFHLINVRGGLAHEARVVRRVGLEAGLWLASTVDFSAPIDPALEYLRRLWTLRSACG